MKTINNKIFPLNKMRQKFVKKSYCKKILSQPYFHIKHICSLHCPVLIFASQTNLNSNLLRKWKKEILIMIKELGTIFKTFYGSASKNTVFLVWIFFKGGLISLGRSKLKISSKVLPPLLTQADRNQVSTSIFLIKCHFT